MRIRPGNPRNGKQLRREDFVETETDVPSTRVIFEEGIRVACISNNTIILTNNEFCLVVVDRATHPNAGANVAVCLPENVKGRMVLFSSPTIR